MMETDEINERYIAPCFLNCLEAYDGEVNLKFDENLISNKFAVKLCLDYAVKKGKKLVKKELVVALKGELYFVKFIINPEEDDSEPGVILGRSFLRLDHGVVDFGNGVITIYPEPDPFEDNYEKIGKSSDDWNQLLYFNFEDVPKDKVKLDGKTVKEEEDAVERIKGEALKEKDDPGKEEMKKIDRGITMINHTQVEAMGKLSNVLCQVGVTTIIAKFLILDIQIDRDAPIMVGRGLLYTMGSIPNTPDRLFSTFDGVCHQTFRAVRFDHLRTAESDSDDDEEYVIKINRTHKGEAGSSRSKRPRQHETVEEVLLPQVHHEFLLWEGCSRDAKSRYNTRLAQLLPRHIYSPCIVNWDVLNQMGCDGEIDDMLRIRVREAGSDEEIFTSVAWIRSFNINQPIYAELCHEFYSTYEFDEVLGLYKVTELEEEGFNVYFEGGLFNDEHFNAQAYWLSISREKHLGLSRSHASTIRNLILRVIHKMITYGLCQRTTGVLTEDVVRSLSAPIYFRDLDTTTLKDLIDSDAIEHMEYKQSYHWDMYHGVFEHMAGVYSVLLQGAYNPPGYAQPQYKQYYQQYQAPPPQYHQQQDDDE
nr:hypothetical protein [Tanacetum cinerariifolium]